jgi:hypothetical protein|tara:strand:- start:761 stop:1264 length:504 start_codon:yes stop_codon:yes gene_type:complete
MASNKWTQPAQPPPPLFVGQAERNFVKQINDEVIEKVVGQQVLYFPIDIERSKYHTLYGEALNKTFLPPVRAYALVEYLGSTRTQTEIGFDNVYNISVHFHKRRLTADQNLFVRLGDFVQYDQLYFEIVDVFEPRYLFGQDSDFADGTSLEVTAIGREAREGLFDAN